MQEIQFKKSQNSKVQDIKFSLQSIKPEFGKKFETAVIEDIVFDQNMINRIKDVQKKGVADIK